MIRITAKKDCCGCTACEAVCPKRCISMVADNEGFCYPQVNTDSCINCHLCEKVCPIINHRVKDKTPEVYGLINLDKATLAESTSGGAFWGLVEYVVRQGGVVFGAVYDEAFRVHHARETTIDGCKRFHGAKYVESHITDGLFAEVKRDLESGILVLFSGTPCQVAGLKGFLRKDYENLISCDLVCSSVPSPMVFNDFLDFVAQKKKIKEINMRWKGKGWLKTRSRFIYKDGTMDSGKGYARLWHTIAFSHLVSRPSCHVCRFTNFNRPGDFTIGDFWGFEKAFPDVDNTKGVSLMLVNSPKGQEIFQAIKAGFKIIESNVEHCTQPRLKSPVKPNPRRSEFWQEYSKDAFHHIARKYWHYGWRNQLKLRMRKFFSNVYHTLIRR